MKCSSKFFVYTFGCRCNQADSAVIREGLLRKSMDEAETHRDANLIVVNSCTVTSRTDRQVRQMVRKFRRENPGARLVITGCYAQRDPQALASISGVNLVVGNADKDRLAELVSENAPQPWGKIVHAPLDAARDYLVAPVSQARGKTRPFIKIQDGCDARCSYCIVPLARGPGRSAGPDDVLAEVQNLVNNGYQEIVLTGVHLGTYGQKLSPPTSLVELLGKILEVPGLGRLRLSSIEPMRFSRRIVELALQYRSFARHFHIPLQSGSDRILRRMRRPYKAGDFLQLLHHIRAQLPTAGLGTDIIAGFPGEQESEFEQTCAVIRRSPLTYIHVFPFSPRESTDAYSMPDLVPGYRIRERARILRELSLKKNLEFRRRFLGLVLPAIILAEEEEMGESVALTENYIHVRLSGMRVATNRLVEVRIEDVQPHETTGSLVT